MLGDRSLNKGAFLDVAHSSFFQLLLPVALKSALSGRKQFPAGELQLRMTELYYVCPTVVDRTFDGHIASEYTVDLKRVRTVMPVRQKDVLKTSKSLNL